MMPIMVTSLGGLALRSKKRTFSWPEAPAVAAKRTETPKQNLVAESFMMNISFFERSPQSWVHHRNGRMQRTLNDESLLENRFFSFFQLVVLPLQGRFLLEEVVEFLS